MTSSVRRGSGAFYRVGARGLHSVRALASSPAGPSGTYTLICFPGAGGNAAQFQSWSDELRGTDPPEVLAYQPAGRSGRIDEPAADSWLALISDISRNLVALQDQVSQPCIFLGASLGASWAFEAARAAISHRIDVAGVIAMSASSPSERAAVEARLPGHDDILRTMPELREADPRSLPALLEIHREAVSADLRLLETYTAPPGRVHFPICVIAGVDDETVKISDAERWATMTTAECTLLLADGDHFLFKRIHHQGVKEAVAKAIEIVRRGSFKSD